MLIAAVVGAYIALAINHDRIAGIWALLVGIAVAFAALPLYVRPIVDRERTRLRRQYEPDGAPDARRAHWRRASRVYRSASPAVAQ